MNKEELERLWLDKSNWRFFYAVYYCKADPRLVVPKPNFAGTPKKWLGTTWNLAHPMVFPVMLMFILLALAPTGILLIAGIDNIWLIGACFVGSVYVALEIAWQLASPHA